MDVANLRQRFYVLTNEADQAQMANTRIGYLAAVEKCKEAATVADLIGGAEGADRHARADQLIANCLIRLGNLAAAAHAACSSLRMARAAGSRTLLVRSLIICGQVANQAPDEMAKAERESREQERHGGSPSYGGLDLSEEGRVSLPTNTATLSRLSLAYNEAAVATCDAALTATGGRDSPAADDEEIVLSLHMESEARGSLGGFLIVLGEFQRGLELIRQALALLRQAVQRAEPGVVALRAKQALATWLCNMGGVLNTPGMGDIGNAPGADRIVEAEACLREALELCDNTDTVMLNQMVLSQLANMSGRPDQPVGPAEPAALRSRLNALYAQAGRNPDTSCTVCLEPLEQPNGGAGQDASGDGGRGADGYTNSAVLVLNCGHQFHRGYLSTWWRTTTSATCPLCKK